MRIWIGLGSNIGDGPGMIGEALRRIEGLPGVTLVRRSGLYRSAPWGDQDQADFTNAVAELDTGMPPLELLVRLHGIECAMGRKRGGRRWGPRSMDLDILLVSDRILVLEGLRVPHPKMHLRAFVLTPLAELAPELLIPGRGTVDSCLAKISVQPVQKLAGGQPVADGKR